jgi:hypothetical protein
MIVARGEALQMYCPFKFSAQIENPFCSQGSCMAWRFLNIKNDHEESFGYCGLVGKPAKEDYEINLQS